MKKSIFVILSLALALNASAQEGNEVQKAFGEGGVSVSGQPVPFRHETLGKGSLADEFKTFEQKFPRLMKVMEMKHALNEERREAAKSLKSSQNQTRLGESPRLTLSIKTHLVLTSRGVELVDLPPVPQPIDNSENAILRRALRFLFDATKHDYKEANETVQSIAETALSIDDYDVRADAFNLLGKFVVSRDWKGTEAKVKDEPYSPPVRVIYAINHLYRSGRFGYLDKLRMTEILQKASSQSDIHKVAVEVMDGLRRDKLLIETK